MKAYLILENGVTVEGVACGSVKESVGELVFTTGTVGYLETLTDPSYAGQIIIQTFPMIGNYGVIPEDFEGRSVASGYVVRELCDEPSNFRSKGCLDDFLKEHGIPGICGVDTRRLVKILREHGTMRAKIVYEKTDDLSDLKKFSVGDAVSRVTSHTTATYLPEGKEKFSVVLVDYGAKGNIIKCLVRRGCRVTLVGADTTAEEILSLSPDGIVLSNGPGDPKENTVRIAEIKKLAGTLPMFGICLGHQIMALALGGDTVKLKFGHRGANQPVKELSTGRVYITSQNHGYAVVSDSLFGVGDVSFINTNDGSCEGMDYPAKKCFTVQFHPEAAAGPLDTEYLFDKFIDMLGGE